MHAVVVTGGAPVPDAVAERLPADPFVVAADSGLDHALALGLRVDVVVGDLDSVSASALTEAARRATPIERFRSDKDQTDTELAVDAAVARGVDAITLVNGGGDRLDHLLGMLAVLAAPRLAGITVDAWVGEAWVAVVHPGRERTVAGRAGEYVSLIPLGNAAGGVHTHGLRWRLDGDVLDPAGGISNELLGTSATVSVEAGRLLVVQPYALRTG